MSRRSAERPPSSLETTATARTLRDTLHELPVDALVPDGWLVGTEVVKFGDELPEDGVTLSHGDYPRELVITPAGTSGGETLAVYERDRVAGRRTLVAGVAAAGDDGGDGRGDDAAELEAGLRAAARAAARIESGESGAATVDRGEPSVSLPLSLGDGSGDREVKVTFY